MTIDVTGIGNAIMDVVAECDEDFVQAQGLAKGSMTLIDAAQAERLYAELKGVESSGGSAANTIAGLASFGGKGAFIGKVADDALGAAFTADVKALGAEFDSAPLSGGAPTARCIVLVTPDGERTMNTYLGACVELSPEDIDAARIEDSKVTYLEGYLYDPPKAQAAFQEAVRIAKAAGNQIALSLSDSFCVDRHREGFLELIQAGVDILFANEEEAKSLTQTDSFEAAVGAMQELVEVAAITRAEQGSVVLTAEDIYEVVAIPTRLVDSTGAGDLYAAGFLYGYTQGMEASEWGRLGAIASSEVISEFGARPKRPLKELL